MTRPRKCGIGLVLSLFALLTAASVAHAEPVVHFTVIQTSDLHSHFTNRDDPLGRGGLARVLGKVNEIRNSRENTLLLDAGDWSEGNMFFTLDSGETSQRLLEAMKYDAIVLGNHDWLIGPAALYKAFTDAQMQIPVLSANSDLSQVPPWIRLKDYMKPYVVKEVGGVRVGILGLSTFEMIYDAFWSPAKLLDPVKTAQKFVRRLREREKCQVVIVLSHLGIDADKDLAAKVKGINYIVGGHTHLLLKQPAYVRNVPITHVGAWGRFVGQTDLVFDGHNVSVENYEVHPIDGNVPEDPAMRALIDGSIARMEQKYGSIFSDNVMYSDVALPAQNLYAESQLNNWAVDAVREVGGAQLAIDTPYFASRDLMPGYSSTFDVFNVFPHIYNPVTGKTWTIKTFKINGLILKLLASQVHRMGFNINLSHAAMVMDASSGSLKLRDFRVAGQPLRWYDNYKIACTDGIYAGIEYFERQGLELGITEFHDTSVEVWRAVRDKLMSLSPITPAKISWEGRVRLMQPDLEVRGEEIQAAPITAQTAAVNIRVRNTGLQPTAPSQVFVMPANETQGPLAERQMGLQGSAPVRALQPGEADDVRIELDTSTLSRSRYLLSVSVAIVPGEFEVRNNSAETVLSLEP